MFDLVKNIFNFLDSHNGAITIVWTVLVALVVFVFKFFQFINIKRKDSKQRDYENYHKLIKDLNQSDTPNESIKLFRQIAVVYELRNFPRYFPVTKRILNNWPRKIDECSLLYNEMDDTINYINYNCFVRFIVKRLKIK